MGFILILFFWVSRISSWRKDSSLIKIWCKYHCNSSSLCNMFLHHPQSSLFVFLEELEDLFFCFKKEKVRALHSFSPVFCDTSVGICISWLLIPQKRGKWSTEVVVVTSKNESLEHFSWENNTFFIPAWKSSVTAWILAAVFAVLHVPISIFSI